jgi:hypothetical protein
MEKSHLGPEQPNSAQSAGPHLSVSFPSPALARAPAPSLSLSGRWDQDDGANSPRARPSLSLRSGTRPSALNFHSLACSRWSVGPACRTRPSRTAHAHDPRVIVDSAPTTHAKVTPTPPWPFLAAQYSIRSPSSLTRSLAHLNTRLAPLVHQRSSTAVHRGIGPVLRPPPGPYHVCYFVSYTSMPATQDTPRFAPSPSIFHCSGSLDLHRAAEAPPPSTQGLPTSPPPLKRPRALSRGKQPPHAPDFPSPTPVRVQLLTGASLRRSYATPPQTATLRFPCVGVAPTTASAVSSRALPSTLGPLMWPRLRLRRGFVAESGGSAAGC